MGTLDAAVDDYLSVRRALGFQLTAVGVLLHQFACFADTVGADTITTDLARAWATQPTGCSVTWYAQRLSAVRCFARWLQAIEPGTQVPPADLLPAQGPRRVTPYLYSDTDIADLVTAAGGLDTPLAALTMQTFIGLIFATGLRRGEALSLDRGDLEPDTGVLSVRQAKFHKPRQLPLHASTVAALGDYATRRDRLLPRHHSAALFVSSAGARLSASTVSAAFRRVLAQTGITQRAPGRPPRIHDARHTFAVNTLLDWYHDGGDVQAGLPLLSTWLGHTDPRHTYWYLQAAPELLALTAQRLDHTSGAAS